MLTDSVKVTGELQIRRLRDGVITHEYEGKNLVVTTGTNLIAARLAGYGTVISHMGVGIDQTAPSSTNTALASQVGRTTVVTTYNNTNEVVYTATFAPGIGTGDLTEAGLFNASTGGTMLARTIFPAFEKSVADTVTIQWKIKIN